MHIMTERIVGFLTLYLLQIIISLVFSAFKPMKNKGKKLVYLTVSLGLLAFMTMFRSFEIGTDTMAYVNYFNYIKYSNFSSAATKGYFEIGYNVYVWILSQITKNPQILLVVTGLLIYISLLRWLFKWCENPGVFVCLFVAILQFDFWISAMRQVLTIAIILFAYDSAVNKKPIKFTLQLFFASLFHSSSLVFLIIYPIINFRHTFTFGKRKFSINSIMICFALVGFIMFKQFIDKVFEFLPRYSIYEGSVYFDDTPRLAVVTKIVVFGLMILVPLFFQDKKNRFENLRKSEFRLALANELIYLLALRATILTRINGTLNIFTLLFFSNSISIISNEKNKNILLAITLICFGIYGSVITALRTPMWQTTYPFVFFWNE